MHSDSDGVSTRLARHFDREWCGESQLSSLASDFASSRASRTLSSVRSSDAVIAAAAAARLGWPRCRPRAPRVGVLKLGRHAYDGLENI
jgi:hypothetical protein